MTTLAAGVAPPQNIAAECGVLGAVLLSDVVLPALLLDEGLRPEHFFRDRHRVIWRAMSAMSAAGQPVDVLTLAAHLDDAGTLQAAGGQAAIDELTGGVPGLGGVRHYAQIVIENSCWRTRVDAAHEQLAATRDRDEAAHQRALSAASAVTTLPPSSMKAKLVDGGAFILDAPTCIPAVWGEGSEVLWAQGEPMMICGPQGVGKSTVAQQLVLARLGVFNPDVLGMAVTADPERRVLVIAADRPNQIARSMRRMVRPRDRQALIDGLMVRRGPLPFDVVQEPDQLLKLAQGCNAGTVVIDSLKDIAMPLTDDRVGSAVNRALQLMIAEGIEVLTLHHQRKANGDNKKPATLADVYGSVWITAGHGSIAVLWGEPGDPVIELIHVKQPSDVVGPLELTHDHAAGITSVHERPTVRALVAAAANGGITVADAATRLYGPNPDRNAIQKARRKLDDLARQGIAVKVEGETPKAPVHYQPAETRVIDRDSPRDRSRPDHAESETPATTASRADHGLSRTGIKHAAPPFKGARDAEREATPEEEEQLRRALSLMEGAA